MSTSQSFPASPSFPPGQAIPASQPTPAVPAADLEATIGRLVRETLHRQLGLSAEASQPVRRPSAQAAASAGLRITDPVVSLRVLESLPEGTPRVEIGLRAVLTPAAADLLRQRGVQVVRGDHSGSQATSEAPLPANVGCWIADADHPERVAGYVRQLAGRGVSAASLELPLRSGPDFFGAVGVLIAALPAIHVDHFARQLSLSAAAVGSLSEVSRIAAAMSPAVWVLDAERLSFSGRVAVAAECFRLSPSRAAEKGRPR